MLILRPLFIVIFCFCSILLKGQDYQCFRSDVTYSYQFDNISLFLEFDEVLQNSGDSTFIPRNNIFRNSSCYLPLDGHWVGRKIKIKSNGDHLFFNVENDSILIRTKARRGQRWLAYRDDSISVTAIIFEHDTAHFLGLVDSVKTVKFITRDTLGNVIFHPLINLKLRISKNYGVVTALNFRFFPDRSSSIFVGLYAKDYTMELKELIINGISDPKVGFQDIKTFDIYDFYPGDELHILYINEYGNFYGNYNSYRRIKTIKQYLSRVEHLPDFIEYEVKITQSDLNVFNMDTTFKSSSRIKRDTIKKIAELETPFTTTLFDGRYAFGLTTPYYSKDTKVIPGIPYYSLESVSSNAKCFKLSTLHSGCWSNRYFYNGLGGPYHSCISTIADEKVSNSLVYYRKGLKEWGKPLHIVGINEYKSSKFILFPNPARHQVIIEFMNQSQFRGGIIEVFDASGRRVIVKEFERTSGSQVTINISDLARGIYSLMVQAESDIAAQNLKFVKN